MDSLEYIDAYFSGETPQEETRQFEQRIQDDPAFAEEVAFYLTAREASKEELVEERKRDFRALYRRADAVAKFRPALIRRLLPAVAAAALISAIALCWYLFAGPKTGPKLADRYIQENLQLLSVKMGAMDSLQMGLVLFNDGKFIEALQEFEKIIQSDSSNSTGVKDAGITSLRLEDYDRALYFFRNLEIRNHLHLNPGLFYEALTLMKRNFNGDAAQAKHLLQEVIQRNLDKKEDAVELLKKM